MATTNAQSHVVAPLNSIAAADVVAQIKKIDEWLLCINPNAHLSNLKGSPIPVVGNIFAATGALIDIIAIADGMSKPATAATNNGIAPLTAQYAYLAMNLIGLIPSPPDEAHARMALRPMLAMAYEYLSKKEAKIPNSGINQIIRHLNDKIAGDIEIFLTDAKAKLPTLLSSAGALLATLAIDLGTRINTASAVGGAASILAQAGGSALKRDPNSTYTDWIQAIVQAGHVPTEVPVDGSGASLFSSPTAFSQNLFALAGTGIAGISAQSGSQKGQIGWVIDELLKAVKEFRKKGESAAVPVATVGVHNAQVVGDTLEFMSFQAAAVQNPNCKNGAKSNTGCQISFAIGTETISHLDFVTQGLFPIVWGRTYCSNLISYDNDSFGVRWITPYTTRIVQTPSQLVYHGADGRVQPYPALNDGHMHHNAVEKITLTRLSSTTLAITRGKDWVETYEADPDFPVVYRLAMLNNTKDKQTVGIRYDHQRHGRSIISDIIAKVDGEIESHVGTQANEHGQIVALWLIKDGKLDKQVAHYQYNDLNDLTLAQDENAQFRTYEYQNHLVTRYTDRTGRGMNLQWDGSGHQAKAIREWADDGTFDTQLNWDENLRRVTVTNANGAQTQYFYDLLGFTYRIVYADGLEDWYTRDKSKNVTSHVSQTGATKYYRYDAKDNLVCSTNSDGGQVKLQYDDEDNVVLVADPLGNLWQSDYDPKGNVIEQINPLGHKTEFEYNKQGQLIVITDAKQGKKQLAYTADGKVTSFTDCSGKTSTQSYDKQGRLIKQCNAAGETIEYIYSDSGINRGQLKTIIHPDKSEEHFERDAEGRLLTHIDPQGRRTSYEYTRAGLIKQRTDAAGDTISYSWDKTGRLIGLTNANGAHYTFTFNQMGQLVSETGFDGKTTEYEYNPKTGELLKTTSDGVVGAVAFDSMGRVVSRAVKNLKTNEIQAEQFSFDLNGQLVYAKNNHSTLHWYYDDAGQLIREHQEYHIQPDYGDAYHSTAIWRHEYDELGNRIKTIRPDGHSIAHLTYGSGHVHGIMLDNIEAFAFERDDLHREVGRVQANHLQQTFTYDPAGRLKQQLIGALESEHATTANPLNISRTFAYDKVGQLTTINDTRRGQLSYQYDPVGRLLKANSQQFKESFAFDPAGNILEATPQTYGAPAKDDGLYSNDERQLNQSARLKNMLKAYVGTHYTYDERGNLIERLENGKRTVFEWDNFNRMTQASSEDMRVSFYYDVLGRRIAKHSGSTFTGSTMDGTTYAANIRKQQNEAAGYGYTIYGWDGDTLAWESLIAPTKRFEDKPSDAKTTHYIYSPNSFVPLMQATVNESIELLPTPNFKEMAQSKQGYDIDKDPVWNYKAEQFVRAFDSVLYYQCDHLGTPQELTDEQGQIAWSAHYMAWGKAFETMSDSAKRAGIKNPLRFQGQYYDNETGLHYNRHRYYDPHAGRFVSKDPIGLKGGLNIHEYVLNPTQFVDPKGLQAEMNAAGLGGTWNQSASTPSTSLAVLRIAKDSFAYDPNTFVDTGKTPRTDGLPWGDGCGTAANDQYVPDFLVVKKMWGGGKVAFDIRPACTQHDMCYADKTVGNSQLKCDSNLGANIKKICNDAGGDVNDCDVASKVYFKTLNAAGASAFKDAQNGK